jgi:spore germination cell wall hydrolase CwlJ-like protein
MIRAFLYEVRFWPAEWRRRFNYYRLAADRGNLAFLIMLALPILSVAGITYFAYVNGTKIQPARIEVAQREAARAQRRANDLRCLAENIYFEARGEPLEGQYAVAEVTLNRTRAPNFPHKVCDVVHEAHWDPSRRRVVADFSWTELGDLAPGDGAAWKQAVTVASAEYDDLHEPVVPDALYYHATSIRPAWSRTRKQVATIGNHIFYR